MKNNKGLSDVVTTVLIILLVVAAVAAIWAFIKPTVTNSGASITKQTACLTNSVEPVSCKKFNDTLYKVSYAATLDDKVSSVSTNSITLGMADGTVVSANGATSMVNAQRNSTSVVVTNATVNKALTASLSTVLNLADGTTTTCTSTEISCTA